MQKRYLVILAAVLLTIATVVQIKASRSPEQKPAAAAPAAASKQLRISAEGRVTAYPGAEVTIGADYAGIVEQVVVSESDRVRAGDVVALLRADDTKAALAEARAKIKEADADIRLYATERDRARYLFETEVGSRQAWDRAERDLDAAKARRESAVSEVERLAAVIAKSIITSPIAGTVTARHIHPGEAVSAGSKVVTVADLSRTRIEAEIDEYDSARVVLGSKVVVSAEGHARQWRGTVEEIPDTVISRRLNPQDPSKPIDTRVLLAKIKLDEPAPLKLAQRVEVQVATR